MTDGLRLGIGLFCYAAAILLIYCGMTVAPDMVWPVTDREIAAAALLVMGMVAKLQGHVLILSLGRARPAY